MPSSTDPVSLVPRTSKTSSRKQRPGFRPVAKSKKKSTAASAKKSSKPSSAATAVEKTAPEITDASVPATNRTTAEATATEATNAEASATTATSKPAATQKSAAAQRPGELHVTFAADNNKKDGDNNSKASSTRKRKTRASTRKKSTAKATTKKTSAAAASSPASPRRSSRKRKQSIPSSIQIGVTRKTTSSSSDPQKELETETARQEKQQNAAVAAAASAVAAASSTSSTAIVAVSQDQDVLDRLGAENAQGPKLSAFCSEFKSEKKEKGGGKRRKKNQQNQNNNNDEDDNAAAAAANPDTGAAGAETEEVAEANNEDAAAAAAGQPAPAGVPVVQIVDGEIVLQESSLMLPTRRTVEEVEEEFQDNIVEEDAQLAIVQASYNSFLTKGDAAANGGKRGPTTWSVKDTEKFFVALRQLGTDFGSMEAYFDNKRTRRQLKQKYRKELRKNPRLIEELALNPKYKTEIDLSAFDVEVDPKRIEAFENEEPPPYEPTDVEEENQVSEPEKASGDKGDAEVELPGASDVDQNKDHAEGGMEMEEVVEDAIEERRAELEAAKAAAEAKAARKATAAPKKRAPRKRAKKKSTQEKAAAPAAAAGPSPKVNRKASFDDMEIDGMGGFPDAEMEEPSMEDFFENQTFGAAMEQEEVQEPEAAEPSAPSSGKESSQVPLVAKKKSATKSKRPKIRPSLRKKKK